MAFVSKDWRDPGGEYIKTGKGHWESKRIGRLRIFEKLNENISRRSFLQSLSEFEMNNKTSNRNIYDVFNEIPSNSGFYQPHIIFKPLSTKESAITTSLSETLLALDFKVAIRDIRRFGYIFRILQILITKKFANLSGSLQIYIMELLKEILKQVLITKNNTDLMRKLLDDFQVTLNNNIYNHLGSYQLWNKHLNSLKEMRLLFDSMEFNEEKLKIKSKFQTLPTECLMKIIENLTSPQDFKTLGETCVTLENIVNDELLWKRVVFSYFTTDQVSATLTERPLTKSWHLNYIRLLKRFGDGHFFPLKLAKCNICSNLFWPIFGHPCLSRRNHNENFTFLLPEEFVDLFQL